MLSVELDLCDIRGIYDLAKRMCTSTLSNPEGVEGPDAELRDVAIPRLDTVIFNAAYGGWSGLSYLYFIWTILVDGFVQSVTWPKCKIPYPTRILNQQPAYRYVCTPPFPTLIGYVVRHSTLTLARTAHQTASRRSLLRLRFRPLPPRPPASPAPQPPDHLLSGPWPHRLVQQYRGCP